VSYLVSPYDHLVWLHQLEIQPGRPIAQQICLRRSPSL